MKIYFSHIEQEHNVVGKVTQVRQVRLGLGNYESGDSLHSATNPTSADALAEVACRSSTIG